ncbi:MAG: hypothetical protein DB853_15770 [Candidatus Brocadia sp.]|nr:MAG: hypothetical protein DB853_15770 [Candidatus Brocadia sp.]
MLIRNLYMKVIILTNQNIIVVQAKEQMMEKDTAVHLIVRFVSLLAFQRAKVVQAFRGSHSFMMPEFCSFLYTP